MKLKTHSQTILLCIHSCNTSEQLEVCKEMIEHFIKVRFALNPDMPFEHHKLCKAIEERQARINTRQLFDHMPHDLPYNEHEYILENSRSHIKNFL